MNRKEIKEIIDNQKSSKFSFLILAISTILASYFPIIVRYNINTVFNTQKRGHFGFLFNKFQLKKRFSNWTVYFSLLIIISFLCGECFKVVSILFENKSKKILQILISEKIENEDDISWLESFSSQVIGEFSAFFSAVCDLLIEIWSAISINIARSISFETWIRAFFCLFLMIMIIQFIDEMIEKVYRKQSLQDEKEFLSILYNYRINSKFSNLNYLFPPLYFIFLNFDELSTNKELINIVLLGMTVSTISNRLQKIIRKIPSMISTYRLWNENIGNISI